MVAQVIDDESQRSTAEAVFDRMVKTSTADANHQRLANERLISLLPEISKAMYFAPNEEIRSALRATLVDVFAVILSKEARPISPESFDRLMAAVEAYLSNSAAGP